MSEDYREAFYDRRLDRLSETVPHYQAEVSRAVITLSWLHDAIERRLNTFLNEHDLSRASFNVLAILLEREQVPLKELSTLLVKTPANITGLVDGLVKRGFVSRVAAPHDRRAKLVALLPQGRILIDDLLPRHHAELRSAFQDLEDDELKFLTRIMRKVLHKLRETEGTEATP